MRSKAATLEIVERALMHHEENGTAVYHEEEVARSWAHPSTGAVKHYGDEVVARLGELLKTSDRGGVTKWGCRHIHESFPGAQSIYVEESRYHHVVEVVTCHAEAPEECEKSGSVVSHRDDGVPDSNRDYVGHVMVEFEGSVSAVDRC